MRILISGAGIGGLGLAAFLHQRGYEPVLVEQAEEWKPVGYFIELWPLGLQLLDKIGIGEDIRDTAIQIPGMHVHEPSGDSLCFIDHSRIAEEYGGLYSIDRAHLHRYLREVDDFNIRMGTTIAELDQALDAVNVVFDDGNREVFDIVIGADGLDSQVRNLVFPNINPRYLGSTSWVLWLPQSFRPQERFVNVVGNGKSFSMYPTGGKGNLFGYFVMSAPPDATDPVEERVQNLKEHFGDMDYIVPDVLEHLPDDPRAIYHHDHEQIDVEEWQRGRVCLLGDAAHAISPLLGMGASLALEDAYVLAEEIDERNGVEALERYGRRRHDRVRRVQRRSNVVDSTLGMELPYWLYRLRNAVVGSLAEQVYLSFEQKNLMESAIDLR